MAFGTDIERKILVFWSLEAATKYNKSLKRVKKDSEELKDKITTSYTRIVWNKDSHFFEGSEDKRTVSHHPFLSEGDPLIRNNSFKLLWVVLPGSSFNFLG